MWFSFVIQYFIWNLTPFLKLHKCRLSIQFGCCVLKVIFILIMIREIWEAMCVGVELKFCHNKQRIEQHFVIDMPDTNIIRVERFVIEVNYATLEVHGSD